MCIAIYFGPQHSVCTSDTEFNFFYFLSVKQHLNFHLLVKKVRTTILDKHLLNGGLRRLEYKLHFLHTIYKILCNKIELLIRARNLLSISYKLYTTFSSSFFFSFYISYKTKN